MNLVVSFRFPRYFFFTFDSNTCILCCILHCVWCGKNNKSEIRTTVLYCTYLYGYILQSSLYLQAMAQSSSVITFHREFKAASTHILGRGMKVPHALLISRIREKDERCCIFLGEPLMLDWCLLLVLQIQRGVQIRLHGMIFTTRLASGEALMGKILFHMIYHYSN